MGWRLHAHLALQITLHDGRDLRKEHVRRNRAVRLRFVVARQGARQIKRQFLQTPLRAEFLQTHLVQFSRSAQRWAPAIAYVQALHFNLRRDSSRLERECWNSAPLDSDSIPNRLRVTFHAREFDFQVTAAWQRMNVKT